MRNILIILLLSVFWSCTSCNSNSPKTDTDTVPDKDSALNDADTETVDDLSDGVLTESDDISDVDSEAECFPPLIEAPFPYYDKDSNITFCRPGCDTPTEKDPQCMSNLWREQNHNLCHEYPEYDCCGYPCTLETLKPMTKEETDKELVFEGQILVPMHKCDLFLSVWNNDGTHGVVKSWNMSEGKVGFHLVPSALNILEWPVKRKAVTYDVATKKYSLIAPASNEMQSYYKGSRIIMSGDKRSLPIEQRKNYIVYMKDDGFVKVVYPGFIDNMPYEPAMNDKWVFANIREENQSSRMMYAKVGNPSSNSTADSWKWTVLGEGYGWFPAISDNLLSVTDDNAGSYICDLSKTPKSVNDCLKMNGENEKLAYLYFDKENSDKLVYSQKLNGVFKIILAEKEGDSYKKTDLITDFTEATSKYAYSLVPRTLKGNFMLYEEIANINGEGSGLLCYYRIDKKKKYCMKKMDKDEVAEDGTVIYPYGYAEFEGKWLLYQKRDSTPLILRDMECYCKEEGVCPFEE